MRGNHGRPKYQGGAPVVHFPVLGGWGKYKNKKETPAEKSVCHSCLSGPSGRASNTSTSSNLGSWYARKLEPQSGLLPAAAKILVFVRAGPLYCG